MYFENFKLELVERERRKHIVVNEEEIRVFLSQQKLILLTNQPMDPIDPYP
jgi:hypothetical protein